MTMSDEAFRKTFGKRGVNPPAIITHLPKGLPPSAAREAPDLVPEAPDLAPELAAKMQLVFAAVIGLPLLLILGVIWLVEAARSDCQQSDLPQCLGSGGGHWSTGSGHSVSFGGFGEFGGMHGGGS